MGGEAASLAPRSSCLLCLRKSQAASHVPGCLLRMLWGASQTLKVCVLCGTLWCHRSAATEHACTSGQWSPLLGRTLQFRGTLLHGKCASLQGLRYCGECNVVDADQLNDDASAAINAAIESNLTMPDVPCSPAQACSCTFAKIKYQLDMPLLLPCRGPLIRLPCRAAVTVSAQTPDAHAHA